jgi:hypothetical protein
MMGLCPQIAKVWEETQIRGMDQAPVQNNNQESFTKDGWF